MYFNHLMIVRLLNKNGTKNSHQEYAKLKIQSHSSEFNVLKIIINIF